MPEQFLDVHVELDPAKLAEARHPDQLAAEVSRALAEEVVAGIPGARLRHSVPVEVRVHTAYRPLDTPEGPAGDVVLVASRWVVDTPGAGVPAGPAQPIA